MHDIGIMVNTLFCSTSQTLHDSCIVGFLALAHACCMLNHMQVFVSQQLPPNKVCRSTLQYYELHSDPTFATVSYIVQVCTHGARFYNCEQVRLMCRSIFSWLQLGSVARLMWVQVKPEYFMNTVNTTKWMIFLCHNFRWSQQAEKGHKYAKQYR